MNWWEFGSGGLANLNASQALAINPSRCVAQLVQKLESSVKCVLYASLRREV